MPKSLLPACVYPVSEGMEVFTNTPRCEAARKTNLELILSTHNQDCMAACAAATASCCACASSTGRQIQLL